MVLLFHSIIVVLVVLLLIFASKRPKILFGNDTVKITGMFGITINKADISSVSLTDTLSSYLRKSWGLALFGINKGSFVMENGETCKLYTQTNKPPFIAIRTIHSQFIFINFKDKSLMQQYYSELLKYGNSSEN